MRNEKKVGVKDQPDGQWQDLARGPESTETTETEVPEGEHPLTEEQRKELGEFLRNHHREMAVMMVGELADTNKDFVKFRKRLKQEGRTMSEKEFKAWEQELYAPWWKGICDHMRKCGANTEEEQAVIEKDLFFTYDESELHETIEAQAGNYFHDRADALREAINKSDKSEEEKKKDIDAISAFYTAVNWHLDYKYMSADEKRSMSTSDWQAYERGRTSAHNGAISALNHLNDLARKYGTTPFTPRNFWTSNKSNQTPEVSRRMRYDRDVVEEYYAIAFSSEVRARENKAKRLQRFGIY